MGGKAKRGQVLKLETGKRRTQSRRSDGFAQGNPHGRGGTRVKAKRRRVAALHKKRLQEAVVGGAEELEEAEVAENLELLADFVADVAIIGISVSVS